MLTLRFTLTRDEVVKMYRRRILHNRRTWRYIYMGIALILSPSAIRDGRPDRNAAAFGLVYLAVALAFYLLFLPDRSWRRQRQLHQEQALTLSDGGLNMQYPDVSLQTKWSAWSRVDFDDGLYLIRSQSRLAWIPVPRRAFQTRDDEAEFLTIAARHIKVLAGVGGAS